MKDTKMKRYTFKLKLKNQTEHTAVGGDPEGLGLESAYGDIASKPQRNYGVDRDYGTDSESARGVLGMMLLSEALSSGVYGRLAHNEAYGDRFGETQKGKKSKGGFFKKSGKNNKSDQLSQEDVRAEELLRGAGIKVLKALADYQDKKINLGEAQVMLRDSFQSTLRLVKANKDVERSLEDMKVDITYPSGKRLTHSMLSLLSDASSIKIEAIGYDTRGRKLDKERSNAVHRSDSHLRLHGVPIELPDPNSPNKVPAKPLRGAASAGASKVASRGPKPPIAPKPGTKGSSKPPIVPKPGTKGSSKPPIPPKPEARGNSNISGDKNELTYIDSRDLDFTKDSKAGANPTLSPPRSRRSSMSSTYSEDSTDYADLGFSDSEEDINPWAVNKKGKGSVAERDYAGVDYDFDGQGTISFDTPSNKKGKGNVAERDYAGVDYGFDGQGTISDDSSEKSASTRRKSRYIKNKNRRSSRRTVTIEDEDPIYATASSVGKSAYSQSLQPASRRNEEVVYASETGNVIYGSLRGAMRSVLPAVVDDMVSSSQSITAELEEKLRMLREQYKQLIDRNVRTEQEGDALKVEVDANKAQVKAALGHLEGEKSFQKTLASFKEMVDRYKDIDPDENDKSCIKGIFDVVRNSMELRNRMSDFPVLVEDDRGKSNYVVNMSDIVASACDTHGFRYASMPGGLPSLQTTEQFKRDIQSSRGHHQDGAEMLRKLHQVHSGGGVNVVKYDRYGNEGRKAAAYSVIDKSASFAASSQGKSFRRPEAPLVRRPSLSLSDSSSIESSSGLLSSKSKQKSTGGFFGKLWKKTPKASQPAEESLFVSREELDAQLAARNKHLTPLSSVLRDSSSSDNKRGWRKRVGNVTNKNSGGKGPFRL